MKRPSFQFYPGDWLNDSALRMVSLAARGLWIDMICIMHQGEPYGHLKVNSKVIDTFTLCRLVGGEHEEVKRLLDELSQFGVSSITPNGIIFSKRMVKDEEIRKLRSDSGSLGGNPDLGVNYNSPGFIYLMSRVNGEFKIGISVSPEKRAYKLRKSLSDPSIRVIHKQWVSDMGTTEARLKTAWKQNAIKGSEWFKFSDEELTLLINREFNVHLKVNSKSHPNVHLKGKLEDEDGDEEEEDNSSSGEGYREGGTVNMAIYAKALPTRDEWLTYARSIGYAEAEAIIVHDQLESSGWEWNGSITKDWQALCRTKKGRYQEKIEKEKRHGNGKPKVKPDYSKYDQPDAKF